MCGRNKLVPRLLGITRESIMRVDENTKEVLKTWPLTTVRRWAASPNSFTLVSRAASTQREGGREGGGSSSDFWLGEGWGVHIGLVPFWSTNAYVMANRKWKTLSSLSK